MLILIHVLNKLGLTVNVAAGSNNMPAPQENSASHQNLSLDVLMGFGFVAWKMKSTLF